MGKASRTPKGKRHHAPRFIIRHTETKRWFAGNAHFHFQLPMWEPRRAYAVKFTVIESADVIAKMLVEQGFEVEVEKF